MLNNEKFISKAPQSKVDEEKAKLEKYTRMMEQVKERLEQLNKQRDAEASRTAGCMERAARREGPKAAVWRIDMKKINLGS